MDLQAYSHIKLSTRRIKGGTKRSEVDEELDFCYIVELRQAGADWDSITELINRERSYFTTVHMNRELYTRKIRDISIVVESDDMAVVERDRLLEDLDWVASQATRMWQKLKDIQFQDEISGKVLDDNSTPELDEFGNEIPPKKYSKKKLGLVEQHQARYLDTILKVIEMKAKLTGALKIESEDTNLIDIIKNKILDDGGFIRVPLMTSEKDVIDLYESGINNVYLPKFLDEEE